MLCITLQKFFSMDYDTPLPVIEAMKYNIYDLVTLIREKSYDVFDMPSHQLKVTYLLFLVYKPIAETHPLPRGTNRNPVEAANLTKLFESLFSLFKIEFYPEKYLSIFEDTFDTDVISNIILL